MERRVSANKHYALKDFALEVGLSPSRLSAVLKNRQGLSRACTENVAVRLGFNQRQVSYFCLLVQAEDARSKYERKQASHNLKILHPVLPFKNDHGRDTAFRDLNHLIVFLCVKTFPTEERTASSLSKHLSVKRFIVQQILDRLEASNFIKSTNGKYELGEAVFDMNSMSSILSTKSSQLQLLEKAKEALVTQEIAEREFSSLTFAVNKKSLPELKAAIEKFIIAFSGHNELLNRQSGADNVYSLNMNLLKLTKDPIDTLDSTVDVGDS